MLITFCPQMYHLLWIKIFLISAHLPTLSKKPITGVGVKSNKIFNQKYKKKRMIQVPSNHPLFLIYSSSLFIIDTMSLP